MAGTADSTTEIPAAPSAAEAAPVPESDAGGMEAMIEQLKQQIQELEKKFYTKSASYDDPNKLKPIDVKDIEKPDKYDHNVAKFNVWYERFRDLLQNRHPNWEYVFITVEKAGKNKINDIEDFFNGLDTDNAQIAQSIREQAQTYMCQLKAYLRTYTAGELHARVTQVKSEGIIELMREIVYKGKNRNPNRLLDLKAKALAPQRAAKASDLERVLGDWKYVRRQIVEEDPSYSMDDETLQTLLMKIIPTELVKTMRDMLTQGKYKGDYHGFEQALFDEISTRKMDEEARKGSSINAIAESTDQNVRDPKETEYESVQVWCEEWQCHVCGLAPRKRERSRSRSRGRGDEEERPLKEQRQAEEVPAGGKSKGKGRGGRPGGPCWTCGGPHFQRECPMASAGKGNYPITTAWSAWRPGTFPGPSAAQWNAWLPKPKGKGKGKGKGKDGKGGKGDQKGKGKAINDVQNYWGPPLGQIQDPWGYEPYFYNEHWGHDADLNSLLPICGLTANKNKLEEPNEWKEVQVRKHENMKTVMPRTMKKEGTMNVHRSGSRFALLPITEVESDFPGLDEKPDCVPKLKMGVPPKRPGQGEKKKKAKQRKEMLIAPVGEGADDPEFNHRADEVRRECLAERGDLNSEHNVNRCQRLCADRPLNAVPAARVQGEEWQILSLAVDSGAAETVIPHMLVQDHPIRDTEASRNGLNYVSATGDPIPNLGEQRLPLITREGSARSMTFQAAPVDRPLGSVKRMCRAGHRVVFDDEGSYVLNKGTGEINWMREENGNYMLDMWVMPGSWVHNGTGGASTTTAGFMRPR